MKSTAQFKAEALQIHGDKYDYSLADYVGSAKKIKIICPKHGVFEQTPNAHVSAKLGCKSCRADNLGKANIKSIDNFIVDANKIHNHKYDYSLVEYEHSKKKVKIICPLHGVFEQIPNSHLNGQGCRDCGILERANNRLSNNDEYIQKAKQIHGDLYDYRNVEYINSKSKIKIICKIHGVFEIVADKHISRKQGCLECSIASGKHSPRIDTSGFISRALQLHQGKYSYENTIVSEARNKVSITCPIHGTFYQLPLIHLMGSGCVECSGNAQLTTEIFVERAMLKHDAFYDYSQTIYKTSKEKIKIICPNHGLFEQVAASHLGGQGCIKCANREVIGTERFIVKARSVHGNKYDYSKVVYKTNKADVEIICPEHGTFYQQAKGHLLRANGCPKCNLASDSDAIYIWKVIGQFFNGEQVYKIGYTSMRLAEDRIRYVAKKAKFEYEIIVLKEVGGNAHVVEADLLKLGYNPMYTGHSGASEFRSFTQTDLKQALLIIDEFCRNFHSKI